MHNDLTAHMTAWRNGEVSNSEMLSFLLDAQAEVILEIRKAEDKAADERWAKIGLSSI